MSGWGTNLQPICPRGIPKHLINQLKALNFLLHPFLTKKSYVESQIMEGVCVSMRGHNCVKSKITATTRHRAMFVFPLPVTPRILLSQEQKNFPVRIRINSGQVSGEWESPGSRACLTAGCGAVSMYNQDMWHTLWYCSRNWWVDQSCLRVLYLLCK